jgi:hypothetical protein
MPIPKKLTLFINWRGGSGLETIDEFSPEDGQSLKEFRKYVREMLKEHQLSGCNGAYISRRACRAWSEK